MRHKLLIVFLVFVCSNVYAQNAPNLPVLSPPFLGRNDLRVGLYLTRATIAYDRALSNRFSVGIEGLRHWSGSTFTGYAGSLLGRFYFRSFDRSGFFIEEKVTYGFYNPIVYDSVYSYYSTYYYSSTLGFLGAHQADLNYFGNTLSAGFRVYMGRFIFFEFIGGIRAGKLTSGKNDRYMNRNISGIIDSDPSPVTKFYSIIGPGFPLYFNVRLGVRF